MKIRWKLLLVLAAITLVPLFVLSLTSRQTSHDLLQDMTGRSRAVLVKRAEVELLRRLEAHAALAGKEHQIVNLVIENQSGRLREILQGVPGNQRPDPDNGQGSPRKHFRLQPDGTVTPVSVDFDRIRIDLLEGASVDMDEAKRIMQPLLPSFRRVEKANSNLLLWQIVRLNNGIVATYPYHEPVDAAATHARWSTATSGSMHGGMKRRSGSMTVQGGMTGDEPLPHQWYQTIQSSERRTVWSSPFRDPVTGRFVISAASRIEGPGPPFRGGLLVMIPLGSVMQADLDATGLNRDVTSLLVRREAGEDGSPELVIQAEEAQEISTPAQPMQERRNDQPGNGMRGWRGGWMADGAQQRVRTGDPALDRRMAEAMAEGDSGSFKHAFEGRDSLWAYAPIPNTRAGIVLVVPMQSIYGTTLNAEQYLKERIETQYATVRTAIIGMTGAVLLLALFLSRTMTSRLDALSKAFRRLAHGDFSIRVDTRGRDELSELGQTFNTLAPALEEQIRIKEALTIAQEVQRSLLPDHPPTVDGLDVAGMSLYCEDTGGDYLDFPHLGIEADQLGLAVGDVSGHGIPAALLMTTARAFLRQRAAAGGDLDTVVADANRLLAQDVSLSGRFMTLFLFAVDPQTLTARWVRAGHDPALVYSADDNTFGELGGNTGLPLGVDGDWVYEEETAPLRPGQIVLIGTDGIWEAVNAEGEMFGKERLREIIAREADRSAEAVIQAIMTALREFTADAGFDDDVTLAVVKVVGPDPAQ